MLRRASRIAVRRLQTLRSTPHPLHRKRLPERLRRFTTSIHARVGASILGIGVTGFGAYAAYRVEKEPLEKVERKREEKIMNPPQVTQHPYEKKPNVWKFFFKLQRVAYFCILFAPCVVTGILCKLTEDPDLRAAWIRLLVRTIEMGGSSCMKFGQWLSMRPDVISGDVIQALTKLRQNAPAHSFDHTKQQIEKSLGKGINEIFDEFSEKPVASGTIAQVHRAKLKPEYAIKGKDGKLILDVAVKVQHPEVLKQTYVDVDILFQGAGLLFAVPFSKQEFISGMQRQVNFEWEAYNLIKFKQNFHDEIGNGSIIFPEVSTDLLAPQVLVEAWVNGQTISELFDGKNPNTRNVKGPNFTERKSEEDILNQRSKFSKLKKYKEKMGSWAKTLFHTNAKMFLKDNFVHGDLHAGNVMVSEDYPESVVVIDAGCTCQLKEEVRPKFENFVSAMCNGNTEDLADALIEFNKKDTKQETISKFRQNLGKTVKKFVGSPGQSPDGEPVKIGALLTAVLKDLQKHGMMLRSDVAMSLVTLGLTEGLIKQLDPKFDCVRGVMRFMVGERYKPEQNVQNLENVLSQW
mmetsp:Transcript_9209/g.13821  ORF Transcript_9209/g.13821 Transcript_9209/m.13821 type:complete len:576 (-) Transcript_9209:105-1832(-)